ncbi:hypothetical protein NLJ89_g12160 [Agrocybe chaxingu]|uniref:Uncharacterized protein n=1 Tax=Agrocybe chaxingu TaxID=84603 RepID=A0A9W8MQH6_9AGAR|nr:hypothetical protein NLJ89_g12160 [Agrocybe chaxingu]
MSGVHKPTHPTLYVPLLAGLEELGITMKEKVRKEKRKPVLVRNGEYNGLRVRGGRDIEGKPRTVEDALIASHEGRSFVDRIEGGGMVRDLNQDPYWKEDEYVPWEKRP